MVHQETLPITGIIHVKNGAEDITEAIQSLFFCQEVIVADMESSDETREFAKQAGATVIAVKNHDYADPVRQQVIQKAKTEWVFVLDADERVPLSLARELPQLIADETVAAYAIPRKNILFGVWLEHTGWWPDAQIRLFRQNVVHWPPDIHTHPEVDGLLQSLPADKEVAIEHFNYRSVEAFITRLNRYTTIEANRRTPSSPMHAFSRLVEEFVSRSIAQDGWQDGQAGIAASTLQSMYEAVAALKAWEKHRLDGNNELDYAELVAGLSTAQKTLAYWQANLQINRSKGLRRLWWRMRRKWLI